MSAVAMFLKNERQQYQRPEVNIGTQEERLAAQARKATRFLNSKIIRPQVGAKVEEPISKVIGWYFKKPGPGRPQHCDSMEHAMHLQMDVYGAGRIGPRFSK